MNILNICFLLIVSILCIATLFIYKNSSGLKNNKYIDFAIKHKFFIVALLMLFGFLIRAVYLSSNPAGLNQDEASIGYDAFSLLKYGIDRNNYHFPVYLVSWGSGQNVLYAYLSMPFIAFFGLSTFAIRLPALILGTISLLIFYLLIKELLDVPVALLGLFLMVINPWHIMISRWALESNLLPAFLLLGTYFLVLSFRKPYFFIISSIVFGISLYSYALSYIVVPIYLFVTYTYMLALKKFKLKPFLIGIFFTFILAMPLFLLILINNKLISEISTPYFSIPLMPGYRGNELSINNIFQNLSTFINIFALQSDLSIWNSIPQYGIYYIFSTPFIILGLFFSITTFIRNLYNKVFDSSVVILVWLLSSIFMISLTSTDINRENSIFIPLIYFLTIGIYNVIVNLKKSYIVIFIMYFTCCTSFINYYFKTYPSVISMTFNESLIDAINYASTKTNNTVDITGDCNMPYIYVLFGERVNTHDFISSVVYSNSSLYYKSVLSFGRYCFGINYNNINSNYVYVIKNSSIEIFLKKGFAIHKFKNYSVAYR